MRNKPRKHTTQIEEPTDDVELITIPNNNALPRTMLRQASVHTDAEARAFARRYSAKRAYVFRSQLRPDRLIVSVEAVQRAEPTPAQEA